MKYRTRVDDFIEIGHNSLVCPYIFLDSSINGYEYEHAGDLYMVVTPDSVYFDVARHF
jgi:hypothetical protein